MRARKEWVKFIQFIPGPERSDLNLRMRRHRRDTTTNQRDFCTDQVPHIDHYISSTLYSR